MPTPRSPIEFVRRLAGGITQWAGNRVQIEDDTGASIDAGNPMPVGGTVTLGLNAGVDIGDVTVNNTMTNPVPGIGVDGVVAPTITVSAGVYDANDDVGGVITLTSAARALGMPTTLTRFTVVDAGNQKAQLELLFFNANPSASTFTDNAAPVIHANDEAKVCGRRTVYASDYLTVGAKAVACPSFDPLTMIPSGSANLYLVILTPGTPTYGAITALRLALAFAKD